MKLLVLNIFTIFLFNYTFGQVPKKYECLERLFNKSNKLITEDVPLHYLDTINLTLKNTNVVYRKYFYPSNKEIYDTVRFQFEIDNKRLNVIEGILCFIK